ncbi:MAG: RAMP superfamily CRISPR-associated protein [Candidatus Sericytochromatia bacterium]
MPLTEEWWNPYRLLPVESNKNTVKGKTLEKFSNNTFTGTIEAELTNKTLFFVGENEKKNDKSLFLFNESNNIYIAGTSLKGMFRSLAEYLEKDPPVVGITKHEINNIQEIPLTFNMFGVMKNKVLKGKVSFSDGKTNEKIKVNTQSKYILVGKPKDTHKAFYTNSNLRKFYFHTGVAKLNSTNQNANNQSNKEIKPLEAGVTFKFNVYFENLSEKELNLLLYCLALENNLEERIIGNGKGSFKVKGDMCHKLGRAKAYGLGTVKVKINSLKLLPEKPQNRYQSYKEDQSKIYQGEELDKFIKEKTKTYTNDKSEHMENLRKMMIFDPENKTPFIYPDYNWFKNGETDGKKNSQIPLKKI